MVSESALRHLNVSGSRKEKLEVYFDIFGMMQTMTSMMGSDFSFGEAKDDTEKKITDTMNMALS